MSIKELIPFAGIALPLGIVTTVTVTKWLTRVRHMKHVERMRALELGISPYSEGHAWKALTSAAIGAGVPITCMSLAWLNSVSNHHSADEGWFAATVLSGIAVISGGRLARTLFLQTPAPAQAPPSYAAYHAKPEFDPDSYDVVGARG